MNISVKRGYRIKYIFFLHESWQNSQKQMRWHYFHSISLVNFEYQKTLNDWNYLLTHSLITELQPRHAKMTFFGPTFKLLFNCIFIILIKIFLFIREKFQQKKYYQINLTLFRRHAWTISLYHFLVRMRSHYFF
jgi:hypothetical protein